MSDFKISVPSGVCGSPIEFELDKDDDVSIHNVDDGDPCATIYVKKDQFKKVCEAFLAHIGGENGK